MTKQPDRDSMELSRLNMDSSWYWRWSNTGLVVDPWLIGSEIDVARWFNEQWHRTPPVQPEAIPAYDFIVVTQSYSDHCHEVTLKALRKDVPVLCTPKALKRLSKAGLEQELVELPDWVQGGQNFGDLRMGYLDPGRRMDPVYYGLVVEYAGRAIVYAPHGFVMNSRQLEAMAETEVEVLITTFMTYELPGILGGLVNPGLGAAADLAAQIRPGNIIATHDEDKKASGLVGKLAKIHRPGADEISRIFTPFAAYGDRQELLKDQPPTWIEAADYETINIP